MLSRIRDNKDKGGVESDVKYCKGNFWPRYKEAEKQKGHLIPFAEGLQEELEHWGAQVADKRVIRGLGRSPSDLFLTEEKEVLKGLPQSRWSIVSLAQAKVQQTWRIQYDNAFYSVPYQYIGETVTVLADLNILIIYLHEKEIARHIRAVHNWEIKRSDHHAPPGVDQVCRQNEETLLSWSAKIGDDVLEMSRAIFNRQGIDGIQSVRSLCHLAKEYGRDRLNLACKRALEFKATRYKDVKKILLGHLESEGSLPPRKTSPPDYRFQRELGYFDDEAQENTVEVSCG